MTSKISDQKLLMSAREAFHAVFQSPDPFGEPFRANVSVRQILYPIDYELSEKQYAAIANAARSLGEATAFFTETEGYQKGVGFEDWDHWQIDLCDYPYQALRNLEWCSLMESAIYSTCGTWGLIISHEQHAVIGGSPGFIKILNSNLPGVENQIQEFLSAWKYNRDHLGSDVVWLQKALAHIYGTEKAQWLLADAWGN